MCRQNLCTVAHVSDHQSQEQRLPSFDESWSRALCVAAHPDDLEYGIAAAVDRWGQQGKTVSYLLATHGEAGIDGVSPNEAASLRAHEERDGAAEVGVEVVEFLDYDDGMVEYGLPLRRDIARAIRIHKPEVVVTLTHRERFAGGGTNQADHRAVGLAALDASKDAGNRWIHPHLADEGYEPWSGVRWVCMAGSPEITHGVEVTGHMDAAVASLQAHQNYLEGLGGDVPDSDVLEMLDRRTWRAIKRLGFSDAQIAYLLSSPQKSGPQRSGPQESGPQKSWTETEVRAARLAKAATSCTFWRLPFESARTRLAVSSWKRSTSRAR